MFWLQINLLTMNNHNKTCIYVLHECDVCKTLLSYVWSVVNRRLFTAFTHTYMWTNTVYTCMSSIFLNRNPRGDLKKKKKIIFIAFHMPSSVEIKNMDIIVADCASMNQLNKTRAVRWKHPLSQMATHLDGSSPSLCCVVSDDLLMQLSCCCLLWPYLPCAAPALLWTTVFFLQRSIILQFCKKHDEWLGCSCPVLESQPEAYS